MAFYFVLSLFPQDVLDENDFFRFHDNDRNTYCPFLLLLLLLLLIIISSIIIIIKQPSDVVSNKDCRAK